MAEQLIFADVTMSLDGFITGPNDSVELPIGEGGERLHQWIYDQESWQKGHGQEGGTTGPDNDLIAEVIERAGACVMGRRMFNHGEAPWGDVPPFHKPVFVLTHEPGDPLVKADTTFTFVNDGIEAALERARVAAGDKDVQISGGANLIQQFLNAGLLDELQVHVVSVLVGNGVRLFDGTDRIELEPTRTVEGPGVTHVRYRVPR
jgi:dihydrofolate reductase